MVTPEQTRVTGRRAIAHLADGVVMAALFFAIGVPAAIISDVLLGVVLIAWFVLGHLAYFVAFQRRDGQTPGKRLAGIRVVDESGGVPSTGALVSGRSRCTSSTSTSSP